MLKKKSIYKFSWNSTFYINLWYSSNPKIFQLFSSLFKLYADFLNQTVCRFTFKFVCTPISRTITLNPLTLQNENYLPIYHCLTEKPLRMVRLNERKIQKHLIENNVGAERTAWHNNYDRGMNRAQATLSRGLPPIRRQVLTTWPGSTTIYYKLEGSGLRL